MNAPHFTTTAHAAAHFARQGSLAPGAEGFWKVWGATVNNIRPGDLILTKDISTPAKANSDNTRFDLITDTFDAKASPMRKGLVNAEGDRFTLGALSPVIVLRWDIHNLLA